MKIMKYLKIFTLFTIYNNYLFTITIYNSKKYYI